MSFYMGGGGEYQQQGTAPSGFAYGTFPQTNQPVQVMDASGGYSSGSANGMYDAQWQLGRYAAQMPMGVVPGAAAVPNYPSMGTPLVQNPNVGYRMSRPPGVFTHQPRGGGHPGAHQRNHFGGNQQQSQYNRNTPVGPKPIKATEIKSYLYAWCTQKKIKPEYTYTPIGRSPKVRYVCNLVIQGMGYEAQQEARSKREAQTLAAWDFVDAMVAKGLIKKAELPTRNLQMESVKSNVEGKDAAANSEAQKEEPDVNGGWNIDNARQRLNRFCMSERISCDFENTVETVHDGQKMTHSLLKLDIKRLGPTPIIIRAKASNKKQANAQCAVIAVRRLFSLNVIEKHGDVPKRGREEDIMEVEAGGPAGPNSKHGIKRKLEEPLNFDENGNWTLETARAKLQDYFASIDKDLNFNEKEVGTNQDRQYQYSVSLEISGRSFAAEAIATNKKSAQKKCALGM